MRQQLSRQAGHELADKARSWYPASWVHRWPDAFSLHTAKGARLGTQKVNARIEDSVLRSHYLRVPLLLFEGLERLMLLRQDVSLEPFNYSRIKILKPTYTWVKPSGERVQSRRRGPTEPWLDHLRGRYHLWVTTPPRALTNRLRWFIVNLRGYAAPVVPLSQKRRWVLSILGLPTVQFLNLVDETLDLVYFVEHGMPVTQLMNDVVQALKRYGLHEDRHHFSLGPGRGVPVCLPLGFGSVPLTADGTEIDRCSRTVIDTLEELFEVAKDVRGADGSGLSSLLGNPRLTLSQVAELCDVRPRECDDLPESLEDDEGDAVLDPLGQSAAEIELLTDRRIKGDVDPLAAARRAIRWWWAEPARHASLTARWVPELVEERAVRLARLLLGPQRHVKFRAPAGPVAGPTATAQVRRRARSESRLSLEEARYILALDGANLRLLDFTFHLLQFARVTVMDQWYLATKFLIRLRGCSSRTARPHIEFLTGHGVLELVAPEVPKKMARVYRVRDPKLRELILARRDALRKEPGFESLGTALNSLMTKTEIRRRWGRTSYKLGSRAARPAR